MTEEPDDIATWKKRIDAARQRRQRYQNLWAHYARMHTNAYQAVRDLNEDKNVNLPNGDQVKANLVFRNIEQTRALLEIPEIGVRATAMDYTRELGAEDTHRESVVEQALYRSLLRSGLIKDSEEADTVKLDGMIVGHGINYSAWRIEEQEIEQPGIPLLQEDESGSFTPQLDESGAAITELVTQKQTIWEGCQDEAISPLQFLADAACKKFDRAAWHGFERPTKLALLRNDPRYQIPDEVKGASFVLRDIYGAEGQVGEELTDAVMVIVIWDKIEKELLTFIETAPASANGAVARATARASSQGTADMILIGSLSWPVTFSHPDDSPFSFFIPIPARDHPFGISQIEHVRNQAAEADKLRTRQANLTRQIKRIPWVNKNRVDIDQFKSALKSDDMEPVLLNIQDGENPGDIMGELPLPGNVPTEVYKQYLIAEQDVDKTTGVSDVPGGGADTATEAEHIFEIGGARTKRKMSRFLAFLTSTAKHHKDFLREFSPEGELVVVPDVDGSPITLAYGKAAFQGDFDIQVIAGGGAMSLSPIKQKMLLEATNMLMGKFGPQFDRVYLRQLLTMFDFRSINELMRASMAGMMPPPGIPGSVPRPGFSPENYSTPQTLRSAINAPNEGAVVK
jgi:hypothetical protein